MDFLRDICFCLSSFVAGACLSTFPLDANLWPSLGIRTCNRKVDPVTLSLPQIAEFSNAFNHNFQQLSNSSKLCNIARYQCDVKEVEDSRVDTTRSQAALVHEVMSATAFTAGQTRHLHPSQAESRQVCLTVSGSKTVDVSKGAKLALLNTK